MRDEMLELANTVRRVHSLHDGADGADRKPGDQKLGHIREMDDDDIAASNAAFKETGAKACNLRAELGVAQRAIGGENCGAVRRFGNDTIEPVIERFVAPPVLSSKICGIESGHSHPFATADRTSQRDAGISVQPKPV